MSENDRKNRLLFPLLTIILTSFLPVPAKATRMLIRKQSDNDKLWFDTMTNVIKSTEPIDLRRNTEQALKEANAKLAKWEEIASDIETQREALEEEKTKLQEDKSALEEEKKKLESDKRWFQTGFVGALSTTFLGFAGLIVRIPNSALDKRIKLLQITEKEHELREKKVPFPK